MRLLFPAFLVALTNGAAAVNLRANPKNKKLKKKKNTPDFLPAGKTAKFKGMPLAIQAKIAKKFEEINVEVDGEYLDWDDDGQLLYADPPPPNETDVDEFPIDDGATKQYPENAPVQSSGVPIYHSNPGAPYTIYLDFDGHKFSGRAWNTAESFDMYPYDTDGSPDTFSASELDNIGKSWALVAEDFAPFDVDVTTEEPPLDTTSTADNWVFANTVGHVLNTGKADRNGKFPYNCGCGGVAYLGVFGSNSYNDYYAPAFVFNTSFKGLAEAISHEFGHNLGLGHDGTSTVGYYTGHGPNGAETEWAPIMGVGYYAQIAQWSKGEYPDANQVQDDLAIISNKIPYRADDHPSEEPLTISGAEGYAEGIIERNTDVDTFTFYGSGSTTVDIVTRSMDYGNLDAGLQILDNNGVVISGGQVETPNAKDASWTGTLAPGDYKIQVYGTGNGDLITGYSDYGSLGQYEVHMTTEAGTPPTKAPTKAPTEAPTVKPTLAPTPNPTPTPPPTNKPTVAPTKAPTVKPTLAPVTPNPTPNPTPMPPPTNKPTVAPTKAPTVKPTLAPVTPNPTPNPTVKPTPAPVTPGTPFSLETNPRCSSTGNAGGIWFDVVAKNALAVTSLAFETSATTGSVATVSVYTKVDTHVGFEHTSSAWTLLAELQQVTLTNRRDGGAWPPSSTHLPESLFSQPIAAGDRRAFYIHIEGLSLTYGQNFGGDNFVGALQKEDANIQQFVGSTECGGGLFGCKNTIKKFNGFIHYTAGDGTLSPSKSPSKSPTKAPTDIELPTDQYKAVCGSTSGGCKDNPVLIEDETELHEVRCCAENNLGAGWLKKTGCAVWGESEINGDAICHASKTWAEAADLCSGVNARLCTEQELLGDCTRGTGCGYDSQHNWSSTPFTPCTDDESCDDGLQCTVNTCGTDGICQTDSVPNCGNAIVCGSSINAGCASPRVRQASPSGLHEVRCCSDTGKKGWKKNANCAVWGESDVPQCNSLKTLAEAENICLLAGARLCTADELEADCTKGSGCQFDKEHVWSSSTWPLDVIE